MKDSKMKVQELFFRIFLLISLFFPAFYSIFDADYQAEYFVGFSLAYFVLAIYLLIQIVNIKAFSKKPAFIVLLGGLIIYNVVSLYFNIRYLHWYGEQINNSIAFLFFAFLIGYGDEVKDMLRKIIPFFVKVFVFSNILSILYFIAGYTSFIICNNRFVFYKLEEGFYEFRHYWLYSHKSDYSVILICFLAVVLCYGKELQGKLSFWISIVVLGGALVITHSWTGYLAGILLAASRGLDYIDLKKVFKNPKGRGILAAALIVIIGLIGLMLSQRNIFTMGDRLPMWEATIRLLKKRPQGLGLLFGEYPVPVTENTYMTNAHNVFLNQMLRFSVPAGILFTILILLIAGYCVYKSKTWLSLGMWIGLLMLFNMDYSLLNYEVAMVLFCAYLVCVFPEVLREKKTTGDKT